MAQNYFSLLNLHESFDLDMAALEAAYFREQRNFHPDRFVGKSTLDRQHAAQRSVDINHAYRVLKEPLTRAQYLLKQQNIFVGGDKDTVKPSPELLVEIMELREQIEGATDGKINELVSSLNAMYDSSVKKISHAYKSASWNDMAQEVLRLGYIVKMVEDHPRRTAGSGS